MTNLTRRSFLKQTSVSLSTLGLLSFLPASAATPHSQVTTPERSAAALCDPVIAHVTNVATGEISLFVGVREITFRDPQLVARLLEAAR